MVGPSRAFVISKGGDLRRFGIVLARWRRGVILWLFMTIDTRSSMQPIAGDASLSATQLTMLQLQIGGAK
jgi:hypothetical protein